LATARGAIGCIHPAASLELHAAVDEHRGGLEIADDLARGVDLDGVLGADVPVHDAPAHDDRGHVDLGAHLGSLPDDERVVALDLALEHSVDPNAPLELQLPFELGAAPQEGRDLGGRELLIHGGGLPGRGVGRQLAASGG
jgi:hypothetical protein